MLIAIVWALADNGHYKFIRQTHWLTYAERVLHNVSEYLRVSQVSVKWRSASQNNARTAKQTANNDGVQKKRTSPSEVDICVFGSPFVFNCVKFL